MRENVKIKGTEFLYNDRRYEIYRVEPFCSKPKKYVVFMHDSEGVHTRYFREDEINPEIIEREFIKKR